MILYTCCIIILSICSFSHVEATSDWSYDEGHGDGPTTWSDIYGNCSGDSQSPINIVTGSLTNENYQSFSFSNYAETDGVTITLLNDGHTAKLTLDGAELTLSGGDLPEDYIFAQLHFHWGSDDNSGSEHTVDDTQYPLEMHLVHYATSHGSLETAVTQPEGLAVLGFLFEASDEDNTDLAAVIDGIELIHDTDDETNPTPFSLRSLIAPALGSYYRYSGSLTTPGCYESVIWTLFNNTIPISADQLAEFRELLDEDSAVIELNYRPAQALNTRAVYYYEQSSNNNNNDDDGVAANVASFVLIISSCLISWLSR